MTVPLKLLVSETESYLMSVAIELPVADHIYISFETPGIFQHQSGTIRLVDYFFAFHLDGPVLRTRRKEFNKTDFEIY